MAISGEHALADSESALGARRKKRADQHEA